MKTALGQSWDISTADRWGFFTEEVKKRMAAGKKTVVQFVDQDRTLDQNAMSFALYKQIASQIQDQSVNEVRAECKLTVGVPILRLGAEPDIEADLEFRKFYDACLRGMTYEQKLDAMQFVPITSIMKKKAFSNYLDEVIRTYSKRGLSLTHPSEAQ